MIWHSSDKETVLQYFNVDETKGLSTEKAASLLPKAPTKQNEIKVFLKLLTKQLNNSLISAFAIATAITILLAILGSNSNWISAIILIFVLLLNLLFGAYRDYITKKSINKLNRFNITNVTVLRDGEKISLPASEIVCGDIVFLNEGDYIAADGRLLESTGLRCDEYALTGEIVDVEKYPDVCLEDITDIKNRSNMVYAGTSIMHGSGKAIITETGKTTEIAKLEKIENRNNKSHSILIEKLKKVSKYSGIAVFIACAIFFLACLVLNKNTDIGFANLVVLRFTDTISLAAAVLPESLPTVVTIVVAISIQNLAKDGITIHRAAAVEHSADISVICADKTGILTSNNMELAKIFDGNSIIEITDGEQLNEPAALSLRLAAVCRNNGADLSDGSGYSATENAVLNAAKKYIGLSVQDSANIYPVLNIIPFDKQSRTITTVNMIGGKPYAIIKGAPEAVADYCLNINKEALLKVNDMLAGEALRVIAVAYKSLEDTPVMPTAYDLNCNMSFAGLLGFIDPPSKNVVKIIEECEKTGIRTVMITGDNQETARIIARRLGILHDELGVITGEELSLMSDEDLIKNVTSYGVFARITPPDRYRIVRALQHNNERVAITGMALEDAPSLRRANLGITPEYGSADVACKASDVLIAKNDLHSISYCIKNGRYVFSAIKSITHYLLSCNLGELFALFFGVFIYGLPIISAIPLLFINLATDSISAFSMAVSPIDKKIKYKREMHFFTADSVVKIALQGIILGIITILAFGIGSKISLPVGSAMAFATLGFSEILHVISCYGNDYIVNTRVYKNLYIYAGIILSTILMLVVLLTPLGSIFGFVQIPASGLKVIIGFSVSYLILDEIIKFLINIYKKRIK